MLPIMVQNGITNFVNMLDNIMIGRVGTPEMTGVAITNQLIFVFNLCIFGAVSGAGIFGAQFFGKGDYEGVRYTFRFKLLFGGLITLAGILLFVFCGDFLLNQYMQGEQGLTDPTLTMQSAKDYLMIMLVGLVPFVAVQCYSGTLRESGHPNLPMIAGVAAVLVNLTFNYILIFGKFGAPVLGVRGAAIATVLSRFVELAIVVTVSHLRKKKYPFMKGALRSLYIPGALVKQLFLKALPLMANETLWSAGVAMVNRFYSVRGLDAVAAGNISQTFWNIFSIAYMAVGSAIAIILGQMLGANKLKEAKETSYKLITFSCLVCIGFSAVYLVAAEFIPMLYNTEPEIRALATTLMQISAVAMPFDAICHASYFTLRSGGKMAVTFIFDCGFMWGINVLLAFLLSNFTVLPFVGIFTVIQSIAFFKAIFGVLLVKQGFWVKNIIT
ncbi:MAG: MATE family efflux transporter [Clostridia bacterium]|nr:MATE family efflux transporter [Clostridia bacterium]